MALKTRLLFGPLAAAILAVGVVVLSWMVPGYDQVRQTVSEIGETGSPARVPFAILLCVVALCILIFASGLRDTSRRFARSSATAYLVGTMAVSVAGVGLFAFPHPLHNVFGISELIGYQAPLLFAITWRRESRARMLVVLSWIVYGVTVVVIVLNLDRQGVVGAYVKPVYGLIQRMLFVTWFGWIALAGSVLSRWNSAVPSMTRNVFTSSSGSCL